MKELSLNILDITENSVKAEATLTQITVDEDERCLAVTIEDNGKGMSEEILRSVTDPFTPQEPPDELDLESHCSSLPQSRPADP